MALVSTMMEVSILEDGLKVKRQVKASGNTLTESKRKVSGEPECGRKRRKN